MWGTFAIDASVGALLVAAWYLWFRRLNHRRATRIVGWVEQALCGQASVTRIRWRSASHFSLELRLYRSAFRRACVSVELIPREMPLNWLAARLRRQKETVTFKADLDCRPANHLLVRNQHWRGQPGEKSHPLQKTGNSRAWGW